MARTESSDILKSDVFHRTRPEGEVISAGAYNALIGLVLCWGFLVNFALVKQVDPATLRSVHPLVFLLGYFASCLAGVYLFNTSREPVVSFIGYNLVVVPFGLVVNLVVSRYDRDLVLDALSVTSVVTVTMMAIGSAVPAFFQRIRNALTVSLLAVVLYELFMVFVVGRAPAPWTDWAVALIFCGYIGYDWGRANRIPKTVDNAIDSAAAIYMDIVNLFLRILRIMGRRRR